MSDYRRVALESDLSDGALKQVEIEGRQILLIRAEGRVFAIDAICNHAIGYLEDGDLEGFELFCPLHGGAFDIRTGAATREPATEPLGCYDVRIEDGAVLIRIGAS